MELQEELHILILNQLYLFIAFLDFLLFFIVDNTYFSLLEELLKRCYLRKEYSPFLALYWYLTDYLIEAHIDNSSNVGKVCFLLFNAKLIPETTLNEMVSYHLLKPHSKELGFFPVGRIAYYMSQKPALVSWGRGLETIRRIPFGECLSHMFSLRNYVRQNCL